MGEERRSACILLVEYDLLVADLTERGYTMQVATNVRILGHLMERPPSNLILLDIISVYQPSR